MKAWRVRGVGRAGLWLPLALLLAVAWVRVWAVLEPTLGFGGPSARGTGFFDLYVLLEELAEYQSSGRLYDLERADYFDPGTSVFKYPPSCAAFLLAVTGEPRNGVAPPSDELIRVARPLVLVILVSLVGSLALILWVTRPGLPRALLMIGIFAMWEPHWESFFGPQLEPLILLFLTIGLVAIQRGRSWIAGTAAGLAGALKVYPWVLAPYFALQRRWTALVGMLLGAAAALLASGLVLPLDLTRLYLVDILPHMGGVSHSLENVSLAANLGRFWFWVQGEGLGRRDLWDTIIRIGDGSLPMGLRLVALGGTAVVGLGLLLVSARVVRRSTIWPAAQREAVTFGIAICLVLLLMPTSWANYQGLLALPLMVAIAVGPGRGDRVFWVLVAVAAILAVVPTDEGLFRLHVRLARLRVHDPGLVQGLQWVHQELRSDDGARLVATLRSALPVVIWLGLLRLLHAPGSRVGRTPMLVKPTEAPDG